MVRMCILANPIKTPTHRPISRCEPAIRLTPFSLNYHRYVGSRSGHIYVYENCPSITDSTASLCHAALHSKRLEVWTSVLKLWGSDGEQRHLDAVSVYQLQLIECPAGPEAVCGVYRCYWSQVCLSIKPATLSLQLKHPHIPTHTSMKAQLANNACCKRNKGK